MGEYIIDGAGSGNVWKINSNGEGLVTMTPNLTGTKTFGLAFAGSPAVSIVAANTTRKTAILFNNSNSTVYLGKTATISGNGFPFLSQETITDENSSDAWFGYIAAGSADIRYIEVA